MATLTRRTLNSLLLGAGARLVAGAAQRPTRPNIVMIYADDLGYGDLGCYGHPFIRTPNLDRMAAEGVRFTQFYSAASLCTPSRAALLTGRLPIRSGLNVVLFPWSEGGIQDSETTLAELLRPQGYASACVGKWHLGHLPQYLPTRHGFDRYFGIPYSNDMSISTNPIYDDLGFPGPKDRLKKYEGIPEIPLMRNEEVIERAPDQRQLTPRYTAEATAFIRENARQKKPFFLYLAHTFPHVPLFASDRFSGKSTRGLYGDVVEEVDWSVGEVLRALREARIERNTLVIFSSDNGPAATKTHGGSAGLLRGGKATTWEGGMREPFIAWWPGRIAPGRISQAFGTTMDILPTCVNLAGGRLPEGLGLDGSDLTPPLLDGHAGREPLMFYYQATDLRAVRKGPWKLHLAYSEYDAHGRPSSLQRRTALYHLLEDPSEKYDVAEAKPEVVRELLALIEEHKKSLRASPPQR